MTDETNRLMPVLEQLVRLPEQSASGPVAIAVDHRLHIAANMGPTNLPRLEADSLVSVKTIADDDQLGLLTEELLGELTGPKTGVPDDEAH